MPLSLFQLKSKNDRKKQTEKRMGRLSPRNVYRRTASKRQKAFEELRQLLSKEDLKAIRESNKEFRENF
jgi:hypothetical protein